MPRKRSSRSHRSSRGTKSARSTSRVKSSNIVVIKLVDPILQGLLLIFFLYSVDLDSEDISYRTVLYLLLALQAFSFGLNLYLNPPELLKKERIYCFSLMAIYGVIVFLLYSRVPEYSMALHYGAERTIPLREVAMTGVWLALVFWYNIICFREIKSMLKSYDENE